ncbi:MAG: hypothetical protein ACI9DF_005319, partial [Verrucomicrobiales bacterium]
MVYGSRSVTWTVNPLRNVKKGRPFLFGDDRGGAYPIYIDNLIDALIL